MEIPVIGGEWWPFGLLVLGSLIYIILTWNHDYWKKRGVPYTKPLPLFGNVKDSILFKKSIGELFDEIYWKFDDYKYCGIFNPAKPTLFVRDPDLIREILVKEFASFHDNNLKLDTDADPIAGRNPFVMKGERWKVTRGRLVPAFTGSKLKIVFPLIQEVCQEFKKLLQNNENSGEFEAKELCARFTTDVVASCGFGIQGNSLKNPDAEFRQMGREIVNTGTWNAIKFFLLIFVPVLSSFLRTRFIPQKVEDFFVRMVKEVTTYRKQNNVIRNDYIQQLINLRNTMSSADEDSLADKYPFQDIDVAAQATTFFIDGFETSSGALSFALYALATNPEVQTKLRQEVTSVLEQDGGELTYEGIQKMTYLDMVLSESLRLYPPVFFLSRECTKPFKLETPSGGEFTVEKGISVTIPLFSIHRDPKYYPEPETFDPERFSEENKKNRHKFTYLPFGEGPRICLGMRFALLQVKAGIATVVSNSKISATSRTPIPIVPEPHFLAFMAKGGLWLKFDALND